MRQSRSLASQAARFGTVGIANTAVGGGTMLLLQWLGIGPYLANLLGYVVGMVFSFVANGRWTFGSTLGGAQLGRFVAVVAVSYALNLLTLTLAMRLLGLGEMMSQLPAMVCYTAANFLGQRYFAFRQDAHA